jgi:hypothetical protein
VLEVDDPETVVAAVHGALPGRRPINGSGSSRSHRR